jgi:hypothetical protein
MWSARGALARAGACICKFLRDFQSLVRKVFSRARRAMPLQALAGEGDRSTPSHHHTTSHTITLRMTFHSRMTSMRLD